MYYNCVSTVTKDRILGKAWEAQLAMLAAGKKCWVKSMNIQPLLEMAPQAIVTHVLHVGTTQPIN
jgi:hypothetical protein